jgi:outer membrane protein assembly factor BamB
MSRPRPEGQRPRSFRIAVVAAVVVLTCAGPRLAVALPSDTLDQWNAVSVAASGELVVAGMSLPPERLQTEPPCSFVAAKLARSSGAVLWRYEDSDCESDETISETSGERVFIDAAGDVVVGRLRHLAIPSVAVYKLGGSTGQLLWYAGVGLLPEYGPFSHATILDGAGDVVVGGGFQRAGDTGTFSDPFGTDLVVAKFDSVTGRELWRRTLAGDFVGNDEDRALNQVQALAVDDERNVFVSGVFFNQLPLSRYPDVRWTILKLCGATGEELWRHDVGQTHSLGYSWIDPILSSLAVDDHGDVLAAGHGPVMKLSGANGAEQWRREVPALTGPRLTIAPGGDAILGGRVTTTSLEGDILVTRLAAESGLERWRRQIDGSADEEVGEFYGGSSDVLRAVATQSDGSVLVAGQLANVGAHGDALLLALDAATGHERWRREIDGGAHDVDAAQGLAVVGPAHVAVVGGVVNVDTGTDALAHIFATADGESEWGMECDGLGRAGDLPETACVPVQSTGAGSPPTTIVGSTTTSTTIASCLVAQCDDGDPCTVDGCGADGCRHAPAIGGDALRCILAGGGAIVGECRRAGVRSRVARMLTRAGRLLERAERGRAPARARLLTRTHGYLEQVERKATRDGCILTAERRSRP